MGDFDGWDSRSKYECYGKQGPQVVKCGLRPFYEIKNLSEVFVFKEYVEFLLAPVELFLVASRQSALPGIEMRCIGELLP